MNKLKAELDEMRDELSDELYKSYSKNNGHFNAERFSDGYEEGFNAATDILLPKLEKCRAALEGIIVLESRSPDVVGKLGQTTTYIYARQTMEAEFEQGE